MKEGGTLLKLQDRVAIIVGGSQGIGEAISLVFSEEGAKIAVVARTKSKLDEVASKIRQKGGRAIAIAADVTNERQVTEMVEETVRAYGRVDILVNSAGFAGPTAPFQDIGEQDWDAVLNVNLKAPFLCCKAVLKGMIMQRSGNIISISGVAAKDVIPLRGSLNAAKWGLLGLTRTIAKEAGPFGVRANCIIPSGVRTPRQRFVHEERAKALGISVEDVQKSFLNQMAIKRYALPEEVARACVFLASDDSCLITGEGMNFSGGAVMH